IASRRTRPRPRPRRPAIRRPAGGRSPPCPKNPFPWAPCSLAPQGRLSVLFLEDEVGARRILERVNGHLRSDVTRFDREGAFSLLRYKQAIGSEVVRLGPIASLGAFDPDLPPCLDRFPTLLDGPVDLSGQCGCAGNRETKHRQEYFSHRNLPPGYAGLIRSWMDVIHYTRQDRSAFDGDRRTMKEVYCFPPRIALKSMKMSWTDIRRAGQRNPPGFRGGTGIFNIGSWFDGGPGDKSVMGFHRRQSLVIVCFRHQPPRPEGRLEVENDLVPWDLLV